MKFLVVTFIASISVVIGMLIVGGVLGEEWFARFYRVIFVGVGVAILCVVGMASRILRKSATVDDDTVDDLEAIITRVYEEGQTQSTPSIQPEIDYIIWDQRPRRSGTERHGRGRIVDADTGPGGSFQVCWTDGSPGQPGAIRVPAEPNGFWDILFEL